MGANQNVNIITGSVLSKCIAVLPAGLFSHSDPSWIGTNILHPPSQSDLA